MGEVAMRADTLQVCVPAWGIVGPQSIYMKRSHGSPRRVEGVFKKENVLHAKCAVPQLPFQKRDAVEPKAGHGCRRNNQAAIVVLARFSGYIPEGSRLRNSGRKRTCLRTLALIQLSVIGESCVSIFRNACQEYESQGHV